MTAITQLTPIETRTAEPSSAERERSTRLVAVCGIAVLLGYLPLLVVHFQQMWARQHYQYFPFVIIAVIVLMVTRYKEGNEPGPRAGKRLGVEIGLCLVSWLLLCVAVVFYNPWLAAVSAALASGSLMLWVSRARYVVNLFGIWCLVWLLIPVPLGFAEDLIAWLQRVSSRISSDLLDLIGINHLMQGNVLTLPTKQLFVDEACSGIVSVLSVISCAGIYVVWKNRSLFHALCVIVIGVAWAVIMNVVRIVIITVAYDRWDWDLTTGTIHEALGLAVFLLIFVAVVSTDQLITFFLQPIEVGDLWQTSTATNPLVALWNRFSLSFQPGQGTHQDNEQEPLEKKRVSKPLVATISAGFLLLGAYQVGGRFVATAVAAPTLAQVDSISADMLPEQLTGWQQESFERIEHEHDRGLGDYSLAYAYRHKKSGVRMMLSIDYPFPRNWHELSTCYRGRGWNLTERQILPATCAKSAEPWNYVEARFEQNAEHALLTFGFVDAAGEVMSPAVDDMWERVTNRLRRRGPYSSAAPYLQLQAWLTASEPIDDQMCGETRDAFLEFRATPARLPAAITDEMTIESPQIPVAMPPANLPPRPAWWRSPSYCLWLGWDFAGHWLTSRPPRPLLFGLPAVAMVIAALMGVLMRPFYTTDERVQHYQQAALDALDANDNAAAALYVEKLWTLDPMNHAILFRAALMLERAGVREVVLRQMQRLAPQHEPRYAPAHKWMARGLLAGTLPAEHQTPLELAKVHLEHADQISQRDADANYLWCLYYAQAGQIDLAAESLQKAVYEDNAHALAFDLMRLELQRNNLDEARRAARIAKPVLSKQLESEESRTPERYVQFAQVLETLGEFQSQRQALSDAVAQFPEETVLRDQLFALLLREYDRLTTGGIRDSLALFDVLQQALAMSPKNSKLYARINALFRQRHDSTAANQVIERLLRQSDPRGELANTLGALAAADGQFAAARQLLERSLGKDPNAAITLNNFAWVMANSEPKDLESALRLANKAIDLKPDEHRFRETRGQIHVQLGRWNEAISDLEYALNGMPAADEVHASLAIAYEKIGKPELARAHRDHVATQ